MAKQELCVVTAHEACGSGLFALTLCAPEIAALAQPGQFIHIACGEGNLLRRPISICDVQGDSLKIVFQVKGEGTAWLSRRAAKDTLDVLARLGHGFDLAALGARPVMIGGGIGVPPMLYTMKAAKAAGAQPTAVLGFRNQDAVILEKDFAAVGTTHICTDDGSYGAHGFVSDLLRLHSDTNDFTGVCACGPKPMLKALAQIAEELGIPCQVSMEERMGCGIGACLVCACELKLKDGEGVRYGHVCKDGRYSMQRRSSGNGFTCQFLRCGTEKPHHHRIRHFWFRS